MLRKGWNFHNDIAIPLEGIASRCYGDIRRPFEKIYDADAIERGSFVEVMVVLLRNKTDMNNERYDVDEFLSECASYWGVNGNDIPPEIAQEYFDRFRELYK